MSSLYCLSLIIYMEARSEPILTQQLVASVAMERAAFEQLAICSSLKKPKAYSWQWDGIATKMDEKEFTKSKRIARIELAKRSMKGRLYFNHCKLGKRFHTKFSMVRIGNLCFY